MKEYTDQHAKAGLKEKLPEIDVFENSFKDYEITIVFPEFTSICPRTGLPDFAKITIKYVPQKYCLELKSLKMYFLAYRNLGIFNENVVNRILKDIVAACKPKRAEVLGEFTSRGGLSTEISSRF
ncbi:NADPH-dependent 7-cyano-7-deazaguanine reductase QueF [candidate division WOR-1 bacterium RIFOXYA12_FULL_43_27]|uniref:NADPH-dependent 7-cyano-7-deazaguanine reductase n=1 Tax=candidate division WOR-1 bacterium RIFOXYC2_FULL_46_14 TaxID=1802587 RepID=A0A1F4U4L0_UNCSA|nr:MAG: NADPH-dependent 7-cyano-7-deazaguanine reductase QueF [candidate division WOR-1 bacterium RIFOXYA12_FULL_43_27]OGC20859.1 MAG: NADPH-dependent 7-cyano-7-deazaguanine reductase QueF [candidate division WOR-1 bacterium RIFOXYB2_FULL_46_45]OGC31403.1 MAG: NADPH-dependent 7-cyano-7-deazaguanine reductase QueF [candidate division WOR-1 bacterium RIFOXYA2_FULL_46_56]OGC39809.1 MAG: NADPH-dependent 7-cyano-7-deazaguanine reductase QueF [candidate division WOR-1 bacterium RIFOXYC2_FULL_46_14]